jgi:hypothetical protein
LCQRFDQRILGQLARLVVLVGWSDARPENPAS